MRGNYGRRLFNKYPPTNFLLDYENRNITNPLEAQILMPTLSPKKEMVTTSIKSGIKKSIRR